MSLPDGVPVQQLPTERCGRCGTLIPPLGVYCPNCGTPRMSLASSPQQPQTGQAWPPWAQYAHRVPAKKTPSWRVLIKTILAFGMLSFIAQLALSLVTLVYGTTIVLPEIVHAVYTVYVVAPVLIAVGSISGDALGAYYLLLIAAILVSAAWLFLTSANGYVKELTMKAEPRKHSALFEVCGLMFGVLFLNYVVILVMSVFWGEPTTPTEGVDLWELLFLLANASVWEELIVRVLLIGVPLLLIDLLRRTPQTKKYRYILGGGFNLGAAEVVLLLASSALFGLAHFEGWGAWKVFPSAIAGLAFGYLFLRHGLAAAIVLHFGFDYLTMPTEVFVSGSDMGAVLLLGLALLAWAAMGGVFFGYYVIRMVEFVTKKKYFEEKPQVAGMYPTYYTHRYVAPAPQWQPPPPPGPGGQQPLDAPAERPAASPGPAGPGVFFVCPACGNTGARWVEGRFQCLRCGTVV